MLQSVARAAAALRQVGLRGHTIFTGLCGWQAQAVVVTCGDLLASYDYCGN
jgi:hypothetical protein